MKFLKIALDSFSFGANWSNKFGKGNLEPRLGTSYNERNQNQYLTVAATPSLSLIWVPNMNPIASSYPNGTSYPWSTKFKAVLPINLNPENDSFDVPLKKQDIKVTHLSNIPRIWNLLSWPWTQSSWNWQWKPPWLICRMVCQTPYRPWIPDSQTNFQAGRR